MELNESVFRDKLRNLNSSSASIEGTSAWVCYHRSHARRVATIWEDVFSKADQAKRLALVYLANDIIQNSRRKGPEFASEFFHVVPRALRHMLSRADESTQRAVRRVVKIWDDRRVFGVGGGRLLAELLQEGGGAAPDAPLDEGLLAGLEGAIAALQRAREAHLCAREAVASLATFSLPDVSDADAVARTRACLAADHAAIAGEAAALQTAAAHPLFADGAAKLAAGATAAAKAARSAAALVADLDRVAPSPRSPEVVAPGGPARHGGAEPAGADPLDIYGDLAPTGLDKFPDLHTALQPTPQAAAAEEYDPDDPF